VREVDVCRVLNLPVLLIIKLGTTGNDCVMPVVVRIPQLVCCENISVDEVNVASARYFLDNMSHDDIIEVNVIVFLPWSKIDRKLLL